MHPSSRWRLDDGAAAVENILLASTAFGDSSCGLEGYTLPHEEKLKTFLGIPHGKRLLTLDPPFGVPTEWPTKEKTALAEALQWERYPGKNANARGS
jgi:nitroreductase